MTKSPIWISRTSPSSSRLTPSGSRARSVRSASCNHDLRPGLAPGAVDVILRKDHIAGGAFVAAGVLVWALSNDLPFGTLASPGAGMLPMMVIALMILFGLILVLQAGA